MSSVPQSCNASRLHCNFKNAGLKPTSRNLESEPGIPNIGPILASSRFPPKKLGHSRVRPALAPNVHTTKYPEGRIWRIDERPYTGI